MLQKMGAEVARTAPDTIVVEGQRRLRGVEHQVLPDRIEAGTFVIAAAITGGDVMLESAPCEHLGAFLEVLDRHRRARSPAAATRSTSRAGANGAG